MDYVDRQGQPLTRPEWWRKLHDREYVQLSQTVLPTLGAVATASWLGVVAEGEAEARPFVVTVRVARQRRHNRTLWCRTEAEALEAADQAVLDVLDSVQEPQQCEGK